MATTLRAPIESDYPALGRICYEAFRDFQLAHGFEPDFPAAEVAEGLIAMLAKSPDVDSFVFEEDGVVAGSNFLWRMDEVAGVGPITVNPALQSRGAGRKLMGAVLDSAKKRGIRSVRLLQDAHNAKSISLYASVGFQWRESCALMQIPAGTGASTPAGVTIRAARTGEGDAIDDLGIRLAGVRRGRQREFVQCLQLPELVAERDGALCGYFMPHMVGHLAAEDVPTAIALIAQAGELVPRPVARFLLPLGVPGFFAAALRAGCRTLRTMNLMTIGPYDRPTGVWCPSIVY